jgi:hypothetical protein
MIAAPSQPTPSGTKPTNPPAAHFSWNFLKTLQTTPANNCTAAMSTLMFSNYKGNSSYSQLSSQAFYVIGSANGT